MWPLCSPCLFFAPPFLSVGLAPVFEPLISSPTAWQREGHGNVSCRWSMHKGNTHRNHTEPVLKIAIEAKIAGYLPAHHSTHQQAIKPLGQKITDNFPKFQHSSMKGFGASALRAPGEPWFRARGTELCQALHCNQGWTLSPSQRRRLHMKTGSELETEIWTGNGIWAGNRGSTGRLSPGWALTFSQGNCQFIPPSPFQFSSQAGPPRRKRSSLPIFKHQNC